MIVGRIEISSDSKRTYALIMFNWFCYSDFAVGLYLF